MRCKKRIIRSYKTMLYGQEVTVNVYEPTGPDDDVEEVDEVVLEEDAGEFRDDYGLDLFETFTDADGMWRRTLDDDWGQDHE